MYKIIFNSVKKIIPKISQTEIIALKSGGVSIDKEIFLGKINYKNLFQKSKQKESILTKNIDIILKSIGQTKMYPNNNLNSILNTLGKNGYLSMIIDEKYNGNRISISEQSKIISKISSYNPSLGVVVMVPNSLGPAELLQHYGTNDQKNYYLPKLSNGSFIPCFGLTGPNNGSDATGNIDKGIVQNINGKIKIKINLNKRYITLAPCANLIGIAFDVIDPNNLLKKSGISVALIENNHKGLLQDTFHNPNNVGFPNGTLKGTIYIDPENIIGGQDNIGQGWKMLMECLAVGRGVSLPAQANGSSKLITLSTKKYIQIRKQFNMPIGNMEAIREKFIKMYLNMWIIHCSVNFTNHILDSGKTPSVISAIMKQQTTERARKILNEGMDIYAGSAICIGKNNFFTKFYESTPIGITVEGSNTLTRSLMIFGQGLNKSHPYIFPIFESIQKNDLNEFKINFNKMLKNILFNYGKLGIPIINKSINKKLEILTIKFSLLANFVALLGGKIKSNQMISGQMADILSNLYLCYSILWYHNTENKKKYDLLYDESLTYLIKDIEQKINTVIYNYPFKILKPFLLPLKCNVVEKNFEKQNLLYEYIVKENELEDLLKQDIYVKDTIFEKMDKLLTLQNGKEYDDLYNEIISVEEYKIK